MVLPAAPRIPASTVLATLELVPAKIHLPRPVEMRLESMIASLMERARDLGEVTRGEVVGSLLLSRTADDDLVDDLRFYRRATAGDALPGQDEIALPPRRRGRPRRRS
jgi:hypothetical protein